MRKTALSRRTAALLIAAALHMGLAILLISRTTPPVAETRAVQVTLVQLTPRDRPKPPPRASEAPPARAAAPAPV